MAAVTVHTQVKQQNFSLQQEIEVKWLLYKSRLWPQTEGFYWKSKGSIRSSHAHTIVTQVSCPALFVKVKTPLVRAPLVLSTVLVPYVSSYVFRNWGSWLKTRTRTVSWLSVHVFCVLMHWETVASSWPLLALSWYSDPERKLSSIIFVWLLTRNWRLIRYISREILSRKLCDG